MLQAGGSSVEITPADNQFLYGYPHVARYSTGVHDPLRSSALYLSDGATAAMFIANDIIFIPKDLAARARGRIAAAAGISAAHVMISATHTHSGPITVNYLSNEADPAVPKADTAYLAFVEDRIVQAGVEAFRSAGPAEVGLALADGRDLGTNRRDPAGPADPQVPVLAVRAAGTKEHIAVMLVCSMHPTVLHEDSTLISGDFPGMARQYLQGGAIGRRCAVVHHTGAAGDQSPRHVVQANTFAEAQRLGGLLGKAVEGALGRIEFSSQARIATAVGWVDLPRRAFPSVEQATDALTALKSRLARLRNSGAPRAEARTAECDLFGAEETLTLARAAAAGRVEAACRAGMPAEVQVIRIGPWAFVGWPGEVFVEYALAVKSAAKNTFVISLANGELQGYLVTPQAAAEGGYEASNALVAPESARLLVDKTLELLGRL